MNPNDAMIFDNSVMYGVANVLRQAKGETISSNTVSGAIATFDDAPVGTALDVVVTLPYAAAGYTSVTVERTGKNAFAVHDAIGVIPTASYNLAIDIADDDSVRAHGSPGWDTIGQRTFRLLSTQRGSYFGDAPVTHRYYGKGFRTKLFVIEHSDNTSLSTSYISVQDGTMTIADLRNTALGDVDFRIKIMIYTGDEPDAYEPRNGNMYTITLPSMVYGGTLNLTTGVGTSTYAADGTELETPVTFSVDPTEILALDGINNVWSDAGDVTVTYNRGELTRYYPAQLAPELRNVLSSAFRLYQTEVTTGAGPVALPVDANGDVVAPWTYWRDSWQSPVQYCMLGFSLEYPPSSEENVEGWLGAGSPDVNEYYFGTNDPASGLSGYFRLEYDGGTVILAEVNINGEDASALIPTITWVIRVFQPMEVEE